MQPVKPEPHTQPSSSAAHFAVKTDSEAPGHSNDVEDKPFLKEFGPPDELFKAREYIQSRHTFQQFKAVGVTFDKRQPAIARLKQGQWIAVERDPYNPVDSQAVRLETLSGEALGFVARWQTTRFPWTVVYGRVLSVGAAEGTGALGFSFVTRPSLPGAVVTVMPEGLGPLLHLDELMTGASWAAYRDERLGPDARCWLTAAPATELAPQWTVHPEWGMLLLVGWRPQAAGLRRLLTATADQLDERAAAWAAAQLNEWTAEEGLEHVREAAFRAASHPEGWIINVALLQDELGLEVPPQLFDL